MVRTAVTIDAGVVVLAGSACGARTGLEPGEGDCCGGGDASSELTPDAGEVEEGSFDATSDLTLEAPTEDAPESSAPCDFGPVVSDVFGNVVTFNGGVGIPPGRYRIIYVDGCMKYSSSEDWSVNAYAAGDPTGTDRFWVVDGAMNQIVVPPGTSGYLVGSGGFADFDECVTANLALPPIDFDFAGGPMGVWLDDDPYADNVPGLGGRNPTWKLTLLDCPE